MKNSKVKKLKVGMEFKNYKELCVFLGVEAKTGNTKKAQEKEFSRYFRYSKQGHKIIIEEVFKMAKEKVDNRGSKGKYADDLQKLILAILSKSNVGELMFSPNVLLKKCNMVNGNYALGRRNVPKLSELTEVPEDVIYDFYNTTNNNLVTALETTLKRLSARKLIIWEKVIGVAKVEQYKRNALGEIKINIEDNTEDEATINTYTSYRQATYEEKQLILAAEKQVLLEMGYKDIQSVFLGGMWHKYKQRVIKIVRKELNIKYHFEAYLLTYNYNNIVQALQEDLKEDTVNNIAKKINNTVYKSIADNATNKHNNAIKKYNNLIDLEDILSFYTQEELKAKGIKGTKMRLEDLVRIKNNFVEDTILLNKTLIRPSAKDLREELKKEVIKEVTIEEMENDELPF